MLAVDMDDPVARFLPQAERLLGELETDLATATTPREVAWRLCEFAGRELDLADCVVYLSDGDGGLVQQAAWGPKRVARQVLESRIRLDVGQGVVGDSARQLQPQRVDDTRHDPRYILDAENNLSELAVPIHHDDTLLGVLDSEHPDPGFYDARHEQAFVAIAARGAARLRQLRG